MLLHSIYIKHGCFIPFEVTLFQFVYIEFKYIWDVLTEEVITIWQIRDFAKIVISPQK